MIDIFLSYTEKDREAARRIATMLESVGWSVWWDRRIPAGETWRNVLEKALNDTRCMIVLWSSKSIASEWVCEEASEGRQQGKLIPVLLETVRPPAGFREIQAADLSGWDGSRDFEGLRLLIADLETLLGKPLSGRSAAAAGGAHPVDSGGPATDADGDRDQPDTTAERPGAAKATPLSAHRRRLLAIAGALLLAGVATYLARSTIDNTVKPPLATTSVPATPAPSEPVPSTPPATPLLTRGPPPESALPNVALSAPAASPERPASTRPAKVRRAEITETSETINSRCADLLARVQLGETLSDAAQTAFAKECRQ